MHEISVTLPDGSVRRVPAGTTPGEVAASISPRLAKAALAAAVDDRLVDLSCPIRQDARVRVITADSPEALHVYRHSTAHLLAAAVTQLFPGAQCGIGPATDEGFFYDFVVDRPFVPEDLDAIEKKMKELASQDLPYERQMWRRDEAMRFFDGRGEPLKVQLIEEKTEGQPEVSCYTIKDRETFVDFCVGPHVPSTGRLRAFKLLTTSNAYWKGDARNQPMQRIYGTAFLSEKDLQAHLQRVEEAKKRDHRKLGSELDLYIIDDRVGPGLPLWLPNGTVICDELQKLAEEYEFMDGYQRVRTPVLTKGSLYEASGHLELYKEVMFPGMKLGDGTGPDSEDYYLRPMNCPHHHILYSARPHSYRDLPIRYADFSRLHRFERSGVLSGLTRVRSFAQDDAHIFCMPDQLDEEFRAATGL